MSDVIFLLVVVGFFALAVGLLRACERIIGPDAPVSVAAVPPAAAAEPVEVRA